jgi:hypothetical protein
MYCYLSSHGDYMLGGPECLKSLVVARSVFRLPLLRRAVLGFVGCT